MSSKSIGIVVCIEGRAKSVNKTQEKRKLFGSNKALLLFSILVIFFGIAATGYWYLKYRNSNKIYKLAVINDQCTNDSVKSSKLKNIKIIINNNSPDELKKIINEIMAIPEYKKDQNCLYPIVKFYLLIGDSGKAREYFNLYKQVYISNEKYFEVYGPALENPTFLKSQVEFSEKIKIEAEKNSLYAPEVSE